MLPKRVLLYKKVQMKKKRKKDCERSETGRRVFGHPSARANYRGPVPLRQSITHRVSTIASWQVSAYRGLTARDSHGATRHITPPLPPVAICRLIGNDWSMALFISI